MKKNFLIAIILCFTLVSCTEKDSHKAAKNNVVVFNMGDDKARKEFSALKLDETHPNLLNPSISKDNLDNVLASWSDIHHGLNAHLQKEKFDW